MVDCGFCATYFASQGGKKFLSIIFPFLLIFFLTKKGPLVNSSLSASGPQKSHTAPVTGIEKTMVLPTETIISAAGTPKAKGKHEFSPKHLTSFRKLGVKNVEIIDPAFIEK